MLYCIRIRFGKYMLKFHQTGYFSTEEFAWLHALIMISYDLFETNFNGWKTFGPIGILKFKEKVAKIR